jgi:hypothetical protein
MRLLVESDSLACQLSLLGFLSTQQLLHVSTIMQLSLLSVASPESYQSHAPISKSDESYHLLQTDYRGVISIVASYTPLHPCSHAMLHDLASVLPEVVRMNFIVQECVTKAESVLRRLPAGVQILPIDMAVAVAAHTYDLGISSATADGRY